MEGRRNRAGDRGRALREEEDGSAGGPRQSAATGSGERGARSAGVRRRLADGWARLGRCVAWSGPLRARRPSASGAWAERVERGFWAEWGWRAGPRKGVVGCGFGLLGWFSFSNFNSISYFYFKQSLNSNKNLNSNHTQTIKTMHQYECNTKIKPMIIF